MKYLMKRMLRKRVRKIKKMNKKSNNKRQSGLTIIKNKSQKVTHKKMLLIILIGFLLMT